MGDALYYIGLLPALVLAIPALLALVCLLFGVKKWAVLVLALFVLFTVVFVVGTRLKLKAWTMAAKDGINVNDY